MSTLQTTNLKNPSSGSNNIVLGTDGSVTVETITGTSVRGGITSGTAVASTSGTSIDFTSIPSWVKRVTIMFNGVSTNGTSVPLAQIGAGSVTTSGYAAFSSTIAATVASTSNTSGFPIFSNLAANLIRGALTLANVSSNNWVAAGVLSSSDGATITVAGSIALSGTLDRVRITTVNGTDAFDAGSINILYEG